MNSQDLFDCEHLKSDRIFPLLKSDIIEAIETKQISTAWKELQSGLTDLKEEQKYLSN